MIAPKLFQWTGNFGTAIVDPSGKVAGEFNSTTNYTVKFKATRANYRVFTELSIEYDPPFITDLQVDVWKSRGNYGANERISLVRYTYFIDTMQPLVQGYASHQYNRFQPIGRIFVDDDWYLAINWQSPGASLNGQAIRVRGSVIESSDLDEVLTWYR